MGARSVASVVVSFGMSAVGLKLYLSAKSEQVGFNMINPKTGHRVNQVLVDSDDFDAESKTVLKGAESIPRSQTLKGYEYEKGKYVTFTDEEVANMQAEKRDTLDISEFIPTSEIDPLHVEKTYYTNPDKGMDKQYTILNETLRREKRAAVGTWVSRGKEHLVVIRSYNGALIVHQMFYDTEVRGFKSTCKSYEPSPAELVMGKLLVDQFTKEEFDKSQYSDTFVEKVTAAVETKLAGGEISKSEIGTSSGSMADTLRASLVAMGIPEDKIDAMVAKAESAVAPAVAETPKAKKAAKPKRVRTRPSKNVAAK